MFNLRADGERKPQIFCSRDTCGSEKSDLFRWVLAFILEGPSVRPAVHLFMDSCTTAYDVPFSSGGAGDIVIDWPLEP